MHKSILFAPVAAVLLGACAVTEQPATPSPFLGAAPTSQMEAERRQERVRFSARIVERRGQCNTIRSTGSGRLYSVERAGLRNYSPGSQVRLSGWLSRRNDCPYPLVQVNRIRRI